MAVLINFKICDNAAECSGIEACPNGAIFWDEDKESLSTNNDLCISCKMCESACPIGAIMVATTPDEYAKLEEEIDNDERNKDDLFVERYGAVPLDDSVCLSSIQFAEKAPLIAELTLVEFYNDDSIQCLLKSIPVSEIMSAFNQFSAYYKVEADDNMRQKYGITELPALAMFKDGKLLKTIDGYYEISEKDKLFSCLGE